MLSTRDLVQLAAGTPLHVCVESRARELETGLTLQAPLKGCNHPLRNESRSALT
jgi:hypothetical protein